MSFMVAGFTFTLTDERCGGDRRVVRSPGGVADLVPELDGTHRPLFDEPIVLGADAPLAGGRSMHVDVALRWRRSRGTTIASAVNGWRSPDEDGTQVAGLRDDLRDSLAARASLTAVVSLWHPEPTMWTATFRCLKTPEARPFVAATVRRRLFAWLRAHPDEARAILHGAPPSRVVASGRAPCRH